MAKVNIKYTLLSIFIISACNNVQDTTLGVVSTATPEASYVGEKIMLKGGNAIDAAVAISFALAVTEPAMSGLGGGTQVLLSIKNQPPIAINGTTQSPSNTPTFVKDTLTYHRRSTIPSTVKVLDFLWRNYGSGKISWKELLNPSIELAEDGFTIGKYRAKVYSEYTNELKSSKFNTSYFLINNNIPREGDKIKQPKLAKTLRRLSEYGADDFYNGKIAEQIAADMKAHGGWITREDLNNFPEPNELKPLSVKFNDMTVYSQPPPCGGWVSLLALNLIEHINDESKIADENIIEALYFAHKDRNERPVSDLVNYDSIVKAKLSKSYSKKLLLNESILNKSSNDNNSGETTHFSVVDNQGNSIAVTSSINAYFGALSASEELGFLYNTYMDDFIFEDPDHPFAIRPNAMAFSSMSPIIVQNNDETVLVIGSPGSSRIISTVSQITAKWIENSNIQDLVEQPRIHVSNKSIYFENKEDTLLVTRQFLNKYGLSFKLPSEKFMIEDNLNAYFGGVHAIAKENKVWIGAADPRRDGKTITIIKSIK